MELINISLARTGKKEGVEYTDQEKALAYSISVSLLHLAGKITERPKEFTEDLEQAFTEAMSEEYADAPILMRRVYRTVEKTNVEASVNGWPKRRDPTSIQLIFRKALSQVITKTKAIDVKTMEAMFPRYGAKKDNKHTA